MAPKRWIIVWAAVAAVTLAVSAVPSGAGAASGLPRAAAADLEVVAQGFSPLFEGQNVVWAAVVKNASSKVAAYDVTVTATITDRAGTVVYEGTQTIDLVLPRQQAAASTGGPTTGPGASTLKVTATPDVSVAITGKPGAVKATAVKTEVVERGELTRTTGTLVSSFKVPVRDPETVVVYRKSDGTIVGGKQLIQSVTIPKKGSAPFTSETYVPLPPYDEVEVYANLPGELRLPRS